MKPIVIDSVRPFLFLILLLLTFCKENPVVTEPLEVKNMPPVEGIRIAWDHSTLKKVSSSEGGINYSGYARLIQLHDGSLICTYEAGGAVVVVKSNDLGVSWGQPVTVAARQEGINMAVPEILELADRSLLVSYNPRPNPVDPEKRFAIRTKKSYDGGLSWQDERLLYEAGYQFENGCWEPVAIQLPSTEIQLYFANEGPYTSSNEQNISMLRSQDGGLSWTTTPETVSFRAGARDGMPVPLVLNKTEEIVFAIEDNGDINFKPYIIRSTLENNWATTVDGNSSDRTYALAEEIDKSIYAGAPYLRQLHTGQTILSYQGTEGRPNDMHNADMKVVIGTQEATGFNRKTSPFLIPQDRSCLWNSLSVLQDNTVIALTSTNAYSGGNRTEVWMIKGYVIPELKAQRATPTINGEKEETIWQTAFPVFIGHKGSTQLRSQVSYDDQFLYVFHEVKDNVVTASGENPQTHDGVSILLDAANTSYEAPDKGVFNIFLSVKNQLVVKEGDKRKWISQEAGGIRHASLENSLGYVQEIAIPWSQIGGKPAAGARIGIDISLQDSAGKGVAEYKESISATDPDQPYSWLTLTLE